MKTFLLVLVMTGGIGRPAFADTTDSGNLIIGGQGILQGSMTVVDSAFSVGGTTFSVAGGSVTLGGILNTASSGIKWADGSTSTTGATSGSSSSSDATISGFWTFTATPSIRGAYVMVASHTLSSVNAATFTLTAGESYELHWNLTKNTQGKIALRFNGDTGNNYAWATRGYIPGAGPNDDSAASTSQIYLFNANDATSIADTSYFNGTVRLEYNRADSTFVFVYGNSFHRNASPSHYWNTCGGRYDGASNVTSLSFVALTGTFTGYMEMRKYYR